MGLSTDYVCSRAEGEANVRARRSPRQPAAAEANLPRINRPCMVRVHVSVSRVVGATLLLLLLAAPLAAKKPKSFTLTSDSFRDGGKLPPDCKGDADNVSPHLRWEGAPKGTDSFVLIVDHEKDGQEERSVRWLVYDIPSTVTEIREEISTEGASDVPRLGMKDEAGVEPVVVDPMEAMMGSMGGYEDPEIANMRQMISGMVDSGFDERYRAKEGRGSDGATAYMVRPGGGAAQRDSLWSSHLSTPTCTRVQATEGS